MASLTGQYPTVLAKKQHRNELVHNCEYVDI